MEYTNCYWKIIKTIEFEKELVDRQYFQWGIQELQKTYSEAL